MIKKQLYEYIKQMPSLVKTLPPSIMRKWGPQIPLMAGKVKL